MKNFTKCNILRSDGIPVKMYGIVTKLVFLEQGFFHEDKILHITINDSFVFLLQNNMMSLCLSDCIYEAIST